jgi:MFS family permease
LKRAKLAVTLTFITNGLGVGSFVARIPDIKAHLHISNATLGVILLSSSVGVFLALRPSGKLSAKYGSSPVAFRATLAVSAAVILLGFVFNVAWFCFSLFIFGFTSAFQDVAMNSQAVALEHKSGKRMMSSFHGMFSVGGLLGGAIGGVFSQLKISFSTQTIFVSIIVASVALFVRPRWLPAEADKHEFIEEEKAKKRPRLLWILGFFGFCSAVAEGAAGDWGGILSRETFHASHFISTLPYIAFSATMVIGRFSGDRLAHKFTAPKILSAAGAVASLGLATGLMIGGNFRSHSTAFQRGWNYRCHAIQGSSGPLASRSDRLWNFVLRLHRRSTDDGIDRRHLSTSLGHVPRCRSRCLLNRKR